MNSRHRALAVLIGLAIATLFMSRAITSRAQVECPPGSHWCRDESGFVFCGDCAGPDSGSTDSTYVLIGVVPSPRRASGLSGTMQVPQLASAGPGALFQAQVLGASDNPQLVEVQLLHRQIQDQWKWIVSIGSLGQMPATKATFNILSGGKTVASVSDGAAIAEIPQFPAGIAVMTTNSSTTVTWGFPVPVGIRMGVATGRMGASHQGDALAISVPRGSSGGLTRLDLKSRGTGRVALIKVNQIAASSR